MFTNAMNTITSMFLKLYYLYIQPFHDMRIYQEEVLAYKCDIAKVMKGDCETLGEIENIRYAIELEQQRMKDMKQEIADLKETYAEWTEWLYYTVDALAPFFTTVHNEMKGQDKETCMKVAQRLLEKYEKTNFSLIG